LSSQKSAPEEASNGGRTIAFRALVHNSLIGRTLSAVHVLLGVWKGFCSSDRLAHNSATSPEGFMAWRQALLLATVFSLLLSVAGAAPLDTLGPMKLESVSAVLETGSLTLFGGGLLALASLLRARLRRRRR
jgi:hypothetical protein